MRRDCEKGAALIVVLFVSLLLSLLLATAITITRTETRLATARITLLKAELAADAAITRTAFQLATTDTARRPLLASYEISGFNISITIEDESQRIDLNTASDDTLTAAWLRLGLDEEDAAAFTDRVADWRDEDDLRRLNGAEASDYRRARQQPPGNRPFLNANEIARVLDAPEGLLECDKPPFTIFGRSQGVRQNTGGDSQRRLASESVQRGTGRRLTLIAEATKGEAVKLERRKTILISNDPRQPFLAITAASSSC